MAEVNHKYGKPKGNAQVGKIELKHPGLLSEEDTVIGRDAAHAHGVAAKPGSIRRQEADVNAGRREDRSVKLGGVTLKGKK